MNKSKKAIRGTLAVLVMMGAGGSTAFAYHGDPTAQGPNYTPERHDAMTSAFATGNYSDWAELMGDRGRVTQVVTEDNFARFAEAHQLAQSGDVEGAKAIRVELGLGKGDGSGRGEGKGNGYRGGNDNGGGGGFHRANR